MGMEGGAVHGEEEGNEFALHWGQEFFRMKCYIEIRRLQ